MGCKVILNIQTQTTRASRYARLHCAMRPLNIWTATSFTGCHLPPLQSLDNVWIIEVTWHPVLRTSIDKRSLIFPDLLIQASAVWKYELTLSHMTGTYDTNDIVFHQCFPERCGTKWVMQCCVHLHHWMRCYTTRYISGSKHPMNVLLSESPVTSIHHSRMCALRLVCALDIILRARHASKVLG